MTPVQLPEVPEPTMRELNPYLGSGIDPYNGAESLVWYTAAQLREYATETVRQAASAIFAEGWYLACDWASRDDLKFDVDSPAFEADRAARLGNLFTPSETNSER